MNNARRSLCATMLVLEAIVLGLTTPVLIQVSGVSGGTASAVGLGLAAACLVTAGTLRFEAAYVVGWAIQVAAIALGFVITMMFVLGVVFAALWAGAYFVGRRIEQERAAAYAAHEATRHG